MYACVESFLVLVAVLWYTAPISVFTVLKSKFSNSAIDLFSERHVRSTEIDVEFLSSTKPE